MVQGAHESFEPTSTCEEIAENLFSDEIQPTLNYHLFYLQRMGYGTIDNNAAAGFDTYFYNSFTDMLTKLQNNSFGPSRMVFNGLRTNDAMFSDNVFYGGYYTREDGLSILPEFQCKLQLGTTTFTNCYVTNYFFGNNGASTHLPELPKRIVFVLSYEISFNKDERRSNRNNLYR